MHAAFRVPHADFNGLISTSQSRVGVWTRELIEAALVAGGTYYLPYQPHATHDQFHRAYPRAKELFELKSQWDPSFRFTNSLWNKYYRPWRDSDRTQPVVGLAATDFHHVFSSVALSDAFYRFLQNVFNTLPADRFHHLIATTCRMFGDEESIYRHLQRELGNVKPLLADLTHALPSLFKQKTEMANQTVQALASRNTFDGYAEIGSKGRYKRALDKQLDLRGPIWLIDEAAPTMSPVDVLERGQLRRIGTHVPLRNFAPLAESLTDASLDLVTCYIGLHHMTADQLPPFLASVHRVLRPGGAFILRDHDVRDDDMRSIVSLAHIVFNAGLGETWATNQAELRLFASIDDWARRLETAGFDDDGCRILQDGDPTLNTLLLFVKRCDSEASSNSAQKVAA